MLANNDLRRAHIIHSFEAINLPQGEQNELKRKKKRNSPNVKRKMHFFETENHWPNTLSHTHTHTHITHTHTHYTHIHITHTLKAKQRGSLTRQDLPPPAHTHTHTKYALRLRLSHLRMYPSITHCG